MKGNNPQGTPEQGHRDHATDEDTSKNERLLDLVDGACDLETPGLCDDEATPTSTQYAAFTRLFGWFNKALFADSLPAAMLNFSRRKGARGWFKPDVWVGSTDGTLAEIALNPDTFQGRAPIEVCSTIVHEMVHLWQATSGKPSRRAYHNAEWASKMEEVGLIPSDTGLPGGKRTGQRMTHYVQEGGAFERAFRAMGSAAFLPFTATSPVDPVKSPSASRNKTRHSCPQCGETVWGKPQVRVLCEPCDVLLVPTS